MRTYRSGTIRPTAILRMTAVLACLAITSSMAEEGAPQSTYAPVTLTLVQANPNAPALDADAAQPPPESLFLSRARHDFHDQQGISGYQEAGSFDQVYPGISLTHYLDDHHIEFAFTLRAGADPSLIRIRVDGASYLATTPDGHLIYQAPGYEIYQHAPVVRYASPDTASMPAPARNGNYFRLGGTETRVQASTALDQQRASLNFSSFNLVTAEAGDAGPDYDFYMAKFELTNRQWIRFLNDAQMNPNNARGANMFFGDDGNVWINPEQEPGRDELFQIDTDRMAYNPAQAPGDRYRLVTNEEGRPLHADFPATGISWYGAVKYCNWLTLSAGRPLNQRAYREGTNTLDWAPVTATNWAHGVFSFQERQAWLAFQGFRLPMFKLYGAPASTPTNAFNEFVKAGSWNGSTNTTFGYGRNDFQTNDASVLDASLRLGTDMMPVGFFDGINRLPTGRTVPNENGFGIYDLTGNVHEWLNDPPRDNMPDARLLAGGSYTSPLRPLDNTLLVPTHASDSATGFRPVTTYMPESDTHVNILFCFHTTNQIPRQQQESFGLTPDPDADVPTDQPQTTTEEAPEDLLVADREPEPDPGIDPDIPGILLRDEPTEEPDEPTPSTPGDPGEDLEGGPGGGPGVPPTPTLFRLDLLSQTPSRDVPISVSAPDAFGYTDGTTAFTRFYPPGQSVTVTTPPSIGDAVFQYWARNGQPFSPANTLTVEMLSDLSLTAVYLAPNPPPQHVLQVSSTPFADVPMLVSENDNNGDRNGSTAFSRIYDDGQAVTVTAPPSANGEPFQRWLRNGQPFSSDPSVTVTLFQDTALTAEYGQGIQTDERNLTINSFNPDQDVPIAISLPDNNGLQDGSTSLSRLYDFNTTVSATAPLVAEGNTFAGWFRDGALVSTNQTIHVDMITDIILTARYESPPPDITLTVSSDRPDSGVAIDVSTPDTAGLTNGDTRFERTYLEGTQTTVVAPPTAPNGNTFRRWLLNGSPLTTNTTASITMLADSELTAVYRQPDPPPTIYQLSVLSENPDQDVPITVTTPDINNATDGTTAFNRAYLENTETTLEAPPTAPDGNVFVRWDVDGSPFSSDRDISIIMDGNRTVTAVYEEPVPPNQYTLNVESRDPDSLVVVTVSPQDVNGDANGATSFSRLYNEGELVTLTARNPAFSGSTIFLQQWLLDGVPFSTNATIQVNMLQDHTVTAIYGTPLTPTNQILSVESINPDSNVPITISQPDINGQSNGQTAFDRAYPFGSDVTVTAPGQAPNGNRFLHWLYNGILFSTNLSETVSMIDAVNLTAVYEDLPPIRTLTVDSENPGSGVNVTVSDPDLHGDQDGATTFQREYLDGETVTLTTTPLAPNGREVFSRWERNGVPVTTNTTVNVTLFEDTTMTAIYEPPPTVNLTVRSQNPDEDVTIAVSTPDVQSRTDGDTTFTRTYNQGTLVTLTAPATAPNNAPFVQWLLNGVPFSLDNQIAIEMLSDQELTAVYGDPPPPRRSLVVRSVNPDSDVPIAVSPHDVTNLGNGSTAFQRIYDDGESVTVSAPATAGTNSFRQWILNGDPLTTNLTTDVLMSQDHELIAVYGPPVEPQQRVLTVDSRNPNSTVPIEVSEPDISGDTDGNTVFVRIYDYGETTTLSAPEFAGTNNHAFLYWERDGEQFSTDRDVTLEMLTDTRMTAVYGPVVEDVTLTVNSQNPDSGVTITVAPEDLNAETTGTTEFQRIYEQDQNVALSAPEDIDGQPFLHWLFNGNPLTTNPVANITMYSDTTMTAVYGDPVPQEDLQLTVRSEGPDGEIGTQLLFVTPDNNGDTIGTTIIQRIYDQYESVVITAPATSNGLNFSHWELNNGILTSDQTVTLDMLADTVITAVYVEPPPSVGGL